MFRSGPCCDYYVMTRLLTTLYVVFKWQHGAHGMFQSLFWLPCSGRIPYLVPVLCSGPCFSYYVHDVVA